MWETSLAYTIIKILFSTTTMFNFLAHPVTYHRDPTIRVPVYCNANLARVPGSGCEQMRCSAGGGDDPADGGCPRPDEDGTPFQIQKTEETPYRTYLKRDEDAPSIHEKLDAIMMVVDSIDERLARIEKDIEQYDTDMSSDESDDTDGSTDSGGTDDTDESDGSIDSADSDDSADSGGSAESFDLGQLVRYEADGKIRLGRIAAIDTSISPVSYTVKFEDEDEKYRETEACNLTHL